MKGDKKDSWDISSIQLYILQVIFCKQRPKLKSLSHVFNLRRGSNIIGSTWNYIQCFEIWAGSATQF